MLSAAAPARVTARRLTFFMYLTFLSFMMLGCNVPLRSVLLFPGWLSARSRGLCFVLADIFWPPPLLPYQNRREHAPVSAPYADLANDRSASPRRPSVTTVPQSAAA